MWNNRNGRHLLWCLRVVAILSLVIVTSASSMGQAQTRWTVGAKTGAIMGLIGIEVEREWTGTSLLLNAGGRADRLALMLMGRRYAAPRVGNRTFVDIRVGILQLRSGAAQQEIVSLFGVGGGYEAPLLGILRLTIETGVGLLDVNPTFTPLTQAGLYLGGTIGLSF